MTSLRPIAPITLPPKAKRAPSFGDKPTLVWVAPTSIMVDDAYQRDLNRRSMALITGLVANFAWRKMKPPIVVRVGKQYHCVNGQHTAIAAATLGIKEIPVFVVDAGSVESRADAFVAHNRDQLVMSPFDLYRAKLASADPEALDVQKCCKQAGIRLRIISPQSSKIVPGDTAAIGTIARVVRRRGVVKARAILEALVKGGRGPISAAEIDAVELLMCVERPEMTALDVAPIVRKVGNHGLDEAIMQARHEHVPVKNVLLTKYVALIRKAKAA